MSNESWATLAMDALRAGIKTVENGQEEIRPSWYFMAKLAVAEYEKSMEVSEYEAWQYGQM